MGPTNLILASLVWTVGFFIALILNFVDMTGKRGITKFGMITHLISGGGVAFGLLSLIAGFIWFLVDKYN